MSAMGDAGAVDFIWYDIAASCGDKMVVLIAFLYLALPVLSSGATGSLAGCRFGHVGAIRGALFGVGMGLFAIVANIGYGFLWDAFYEWRYPSVVHLSETRAVFIHYANYQEREIAFLVGPVIIAGIFATESWQACRWWNKSRATCPPQ